MRFLAGIHFLIFTVCQALLLGRLIYTSSSFPELLYYFSLVFSAFVTVYLLFFPEKNK